VIEKLKSMEMGQANGDLTAEFSAKKKFSGRNAKESMGNEEKRKKKRGAEVDIRIKEEKR